MDKTHLNSETIGEVSPEAFAKLRVAYSRLDEKHKRVIVRWVAKSKRDMFRYWMEKAHLPGGYGKKKVEAREGSYGRLLDKVLIERDEKEFTKDVISAFLNSETEQALAGMEANLKPWKTQHELEQQVNAQIGTYSSPFAELVGAYLKCYPPELLAEESINVSARKEMEALLAQMDSHAVMFEEWADRARRAMQLSVDEIVKKVEAANTDADRFSKVLAQHAADTGIAIEPCQTLEELKALVEKVANALESREEIDRLHTFLKGLSDTLRALQVSHRSPGERQRISHMRENAASELDSAGNEHSPAWSVKGPSQGIEWLAWAFALRDKELDEAQARLKADGYANLAELIAHGDPAWISKTPESPASGPAAETDVILPKALQTIPAPVAIPPKPEREETAATIHATATPPGASVSSPDAHRAVQPTPGALPPTILLQLELPQPKMVSKEAQDLTRPLGLDTASRKVPAAEAKLVPPGAHFRIIELHPVGRRQPGCYRAPSPRCFRSGSPLEIRIPPGMEVVG